MKRYIVFKKKENGYYVKYKNYSEDEYSEHPMMAFKYKTISNALKKLLGELSPVNIKQFNIDDFIESNFSDDILIKYKRELKLTNLVDDKELDDRTKLKLIISIKGRIECVNFNDTGVDIYNCDEQIVDHILIMMDKNRNKISKFYKESNDHFKNSSYIKVDENPEEFWNNWLNE